MQAIVSPSQANAVAVQANDFLAGQVAKRPGRFQALAALRTFGEYFRHNFYLTTSGNFRTQTLIDALPEVGADRILFSTDWPFANVDHAAHWFDTASISEADRLKIGRTNAVELFSLDL